MIYNYIIIKHFYNNIMPTSRPESFFTFFLTMFFIFTFLFLICVINCALENRTIFYNTRNNNNDIELGFPDALINQNIKKSSNI